MVASLLLGSHYIGPSTVAQALSGARDTTDQITVGAIRVPRMILAIVVGAALAMAGVQMQAVTRNPLADPGILGINAGASLAVITAIFVLGVSSPSSYLWFAFAGAAVAAVLVYGLGSAGHGGMTPTKVTLAGAILAALFTSFTSAIMVLDQRSLDQFRFWVVGSVVGRGTDVIAATTPAMALGMIIALAASPAVNVLVLGDDAARSLGQNVHLVRSVVALSVVLLAGGAVAAAGPIAFVGLAVPHMVRIFTGPDYRWITAYAAIYGPILLLVADVAGRLVTRHGELQVGICTAIIGGPVFVFLARRRRLAQT